MRKILHKGRILLARVQGEHGNLIVLRRRAFIGYAAITVVVLVMLFGSRIGDSNIFFASLTQELILEEVNIDRSEEGLTLLAHDTRLQTAAQMKAEDMIARSYFDHVDPDNEKPWMWFDAVQYSYAAAAENLAIDVADPAVLVEAWLRSPAHAESFQNGYFRDIGIGIAVGEIEGRNTTVVVAFLGREIDSEILLSDRKDEEIVIPLAIVPSIEIEEYDETDFADIAAEEPVAIQLAEEEVVEGKIIAMNQGNESVEREFMFAGKETVQFNETNRTAHIFRWFLSGLFALLIVLTFFAAYYVQHKTSFAAWRIAGLTVFLLLLWGSEIV